MGMLREGDNAQKMREKPITADYLYYTDHAYEASFLAKTLRGTTNGLQNRKGHLR